MSPWIPVIVGGAIHLLVAAVIYGRLTERVTNHGTTIRELKIEQDGQREQLNDHGERIVRLETKVNGHVRAH